MKGIKLEQEEANNKKRAGGKNHRKLGSKDNTIRSMSKSN